MAYPSSGKIIIINAEQPLTEYQASFDKPSNAAPSKDNDEFLHVFQDVDAAKVVHFFRDKLENIGGNITMCPSNGPLRSLTIKCNRSKRIPKVHMNVEESLTIKCRRPEKVSNTRKEVESLKFECDALNTETVELKSQFDKWRELEQFIKKNTNKDILFYHDKKKQVVVVVSKDFLLAEKGKHKLQVHLGIVKIVGRPSGAKALEASASEGKTFQDSDRPLWIFRDADAAKVDHFFQEELLDIREITTRYPSYGPPRSLTIKCNRPEKEPVCRDVVARLKSKCDLLYTENIQIKSEFQDWDKLEHFVEESTNKQVLLYLNKNSEEVSVIAKANSLVEMWKQRLKEYVSNAQTRERTGGAKALEASAGKGQAFGEHEHESNSTVWSRYKSSHNYDFIRETIETGRSIFNNDHRVGSAKSSDDKYCYEASLGPLKLKVYEASIIRLDVDVIVNAANDCLAHGGGVARVIADAAGSDFNQESRQYIEKHGNLKVSENCVTSAGDLPCKNVIHAVGPQWVDYRNKEECLQALYNCIWNVFETCNKKNYEIVAIPAISAGIYGVPKGMCAKIYIKAAMDFSKKEKYCPKEVHFVDVDVKILQLVKEAYEEGKINPDSLSPRNVIANDKTAGHYPGNHGSRHRSNLGRGRDNESSLSKVAGAPGRPGVTQFSTKIEKLADEDLKGGGKCQKFRIGQNLVVKVYTGDIQKVNVDAIACDISKDITRTGFIISVLRKEGGHDYNKALEKLLESRYLWKINDVHVTVGGNLQAFNVLYLVTERLLFVGQKEIATFRDGMKNLLKKAVEEGIGNIAIPLIGAGSIENDPKRLHICCEALVQTLSDFSKDNPNSCIKELHLVNKIDTVFETLVGACNQAAEILTNDEEEMDDDENDFNYSSDDGDKSDGQYSDLYVYEEIGNFNSFETSGASGVVSPNVSDFTLPKHKETENMPPTGNLKRAYGLPQDPKHIDDHEDEVGGRISSTHN